LVYVNKDVGPTEFITPILYVAQATHMADDTSIVQRISNVQELEEARLLADFHESVEKSM